MSDLRVKVSGEQKEVVQAFCKIDGVWKEIQLTYGKIDGSWTELWQNAFDTPDSISYATSAERESDLSISISPVDGAHYEIRYRYSQNGAWEDSMVETSPNFVFTITSDIDLSDLQFSVRAIDPDGNPYRSSSWRDGTLISLVPAKLSPPANFEYRESIVRGSQVEVMWHTMPNTTYVLDAVYEDDSGGVDIFRQYSGGAARYTHSVSVVVNNRNRIRYRIHARRTGYRDSDWLYGPWRDLINQTLGSVSSISSVTPQEEQRITTSWGSASHASRYQLEMQVNGGAWNRVYWGPNRSYSQTISQSANTTLRWRVRATNPDYFDGPWRYSATRTVQLPAIKTKTWTASSVESWRDSFGWREPETGYAMGGEWMMQGEWNVGGGLWGNHKGLAYFNYTDIRNTLQGKRIESVEVYLYRMSRRHGYYSGQPVTFYTHNYTRTTRPTGEPSLSYVQGPMSSFSLGQGRWVRVNDTLINRIVSGSARGIGVYRAQRNHYIYFSGNVRIRVKYR